MVCKKIKIRHYDYFETGEYEHAVFIEAAWRGEPSPYRRPQNMVARN